MREEKCGGASGWVPQGRRNRCCSDNPSPPEAQREYVMYSPEIYWATAKSVLRGRCMSTLCYRLNLVVSLGDVAHGKPCVSVVPSVDGTVASGAHCVIRCHL